MARLSATVGSVARWRPTFLGTPPRPGESHAERILAEFGAGLLLTGLFFWMIFFGDDAQRTVALDILKTVGTGLDGFGIV
ncbi:MAG: hypothetical protein OXG35_13800, partial [Acidobacteria bacterium]|nr:hypothetical protein [Acidobacteriota bacterium]